MSRIILFYKYVFIEQPEEIKNWQLALCTKLGLKGRTILATEGINSTLGGSDEAIEEYKKVMDNHPLFGNIDFKESEGGAESFPRLSVKIKPEIVHLGLDTQKITALNGGKHLKPQEVHELLTYKPDNLIILDGRNKFEADIGAFTDAIIPNIEHFRQFPEYIDSNIEQFNNKKVLMYCTGGIRCERASAYLKSKGVTQEVYQIEGGIHRYIEQFPDGFFRGKNYVFDNRIAVKANDDIIGSCHLCNKPNDEYTNCMNARCNKHYICCADCKTTYENTCGVVCQELVATKQVNIRPTFKGCNSIANR